MSDDNTKSVPTPCKARPVWLLFLVSLSLMTATQGESKGSQAAAPARDPSCGPLEPSQDNTATARIGSLFEHSTSISMLLQNLKIAYDRKLLLATEFYDEDNLLKFFGSARVTSVGHGQALPRGVTDVVIELAGGNRVLNQMHVSLGLVCSLEPEYRSAGGLIPAHTSRAGRANLAVAALPGLTVRAVRGVFGKESKFLPESVGAHDLSLTGMGLLIYETPANYWDGRGTKAGSEITFKITLSLAGRGPDHVNEPLFTDSDRVDSVEMFQSEH